MAHLWAAVAAYLIGTIPVRAWIGNRGGSVLDGIGVIGLEMAKGGLAAFIGLLLAGWTGASLAAVAVVFGEAFPIGNRHTRGSGVTTATGALFVLSPLLILVGVFIYILSLLVTRYHILSTVCAVIGVMLLGLILSTHLYVWFVAFCLGAFVLSRLKAGRTRFRSGKGKPFRWTGPFR